MVVIAAFDYRVIKYSNIRFHQITNLAGLSLWASVCEASHCRFVLLVDGTGRRSQWVWPLACASPVSSFFSALHPAVLSNGIVRSIPPCLRALSTVNTSAAFLRVSERCSPIVPDLFLRTVHALERCPLSAPAASLRPQSVVHRQCPI